MTLQPPGGTGAAASAPAYVSAMARPGATAALSDPPEHRQWKRPVTNALTFAVVDPSAPASGVSKREWWQPGDDWRGAVSWLFHETLPTTGVCLLSALSGAGKTFLALHLAQCLAEGQEFFGVSAEIRGGTLILAAEAFGSIKRRMAALGGADGPCLPIFACSVGGLAPRLAWLELTQDLRAKAAAVEAEHGVPVRLVILDTLSASGLLEDENDNARAASAMKQMAELSATMNALFVVVHHPPKSGVGERGAGAIRNNADYVMRIERRGQSAFRQLSMDKSRDGEERVLGSFTLVPVQIGTDSKGRPTTTLTVSSSTAPAQRARPPSRHATMLLDCHAHLSGSGTFERDGQKAVPHTLLREEFQRRQPDGTDRSNKARNFRNAVASSGLEVRDIDGARYYLTAKDEGQPLSYRPPPRVGGLTDNPTASGDDNQKTIPDNLTTTTPPPPGIAQPGSKGASDVC